MENLNTKDRIIRTSIGSALLISMLLMASGPLSIAALSLAAFYPLLTALLAWDPVYHVALSVSKAFSSAPTSNVVSSIGEKVRI